MAYWVITDPLDSLVTTSGKKRWILLSLTAGLSNEDSVCKVLCTGSSVNVSDNTVRERL